MNKLQEIQRLRGMACLLVLFQHVCCVVPLAYLHMSIPDIFHYASCGVHIFFMISGLVITLSLKNKLEKCCISNDFAERLYAAKNELKIFFTKRFFRIVPAFIISVIVMASFMSFIGDSLRCLQAWRMITDVLTSFYNDEVARYGYTEAIHYAGAGLYWTLSLEVFFYIIWPILFLALKDNNIRVKSSLIVGVSLWACARWIMRDIIKFPDMIYYGTFTNMDGLFLGTFLGLMYKPDGKKEEPKSFNIWCIASIILVFLMWTHPNMYEMEQLSNISWQNSAVFISFILVWLALYNKGVLNIPYVKTLLEHLGNRSYSFYIYQMFMLYSISWLANSKYMPLTGDKDFKTSMIFFVVLFIATELSYRLIEIPFQKLGNRITASFK